eukprot:9298311-Lingulodinium_polyedra.AAC.1
MLTHAGNKTARDGAERPSHVIDAVLGPTIADPGVPRLAIASALESLREQHAQLGTQHGKIPTNR